MWDDLQLPDVLKSHEQLGVGSIQSIDPIFLGLDYSVFLFQLFW